MTRARVLVVGIAAFAACRPAELKGVQMTAVPGSHASFMFVSRDTIVASMKRYLQGQ